MNATAYGIFKSLHILFVIFWFAAMFYLPRLFVYHAMAEDRISIDRFKIMERKLFGMMTFAGVFAVAFGLTLWLGFGIHGNWLHIKLALVAILIAYHVYCGRLMIDFRHDRNRHDHVFYRWLNEFPLILIVPIVLLVVLKRPA